MGKYRKVDPRIWHDRKFRDLEFNAQYLFLYLLTSPHSTPWGAYIIDDLYIQADTGLPQDDIEKAVSELLANRLIDRDPATRLVCFPNWFRYNRPVNKKSAAAFVNGILALPKSLVLSRFCRDSEWVRDRLANSDLTDLEKLGDEQEQEQEQEQDKTYCAIKDHTVQNDVSDTQSDSDDEELSYESKKGRKLSGKILKAFEDFWDAFDFKNGKADAADAFISVYSPNLHDDIIAGACKAASERQAVRDQGLIPKMAQGWLSGRRWDDEGLPVSTLIPEKPAHLQGVDA